MHGRRTLSFLLALLAAAPAGAQTKLLRHPDVHGERVVFTYGGDLWIAPSQGGTAWRLTSHPGLELFGKFSPDGRLVAFTGQYDGDEQVYVVSAEGGSPVQLTFYPANGPLPPRWGYDNQVHGWTPDGSAVLFRSMRDGWGLSDTRLYTVPVTGGLPAALPMPVSGAGDLDPTGTKVVYSPLVRDFRHWKRYQGGWAQDLWIFDLETNAVRRLTDHVRSERDPMWVGDRVLFTSDRTGTLNLYALDVAGGEVTALTDSTTWDVRWPSADAAGNVVFELQGELRVLDADTGEVRAISIRVPDDGVARRPSHREVGDEVSGYDLSPKGQRALFVARGDVFTVPVEHGLTRNLTRSSGAHDRAAAWSPDGRHVAFVSDRSGEEAIWIVDQAGRSEAQRLTEDHRGHLDDLTWSPDSKRIAYRDQAHRLYVVEVASREVAQVADDPSNGGARLAWSPRGGWLAYDLGSPTGMRSIWIWSVADGRSRRVTGPMWNETSPTWDPGGDYLYYLGDRQFAPQIGSVEWNYVVDRETYLYALALREDVEHPFPPRNDEAEPEDDDADEEDADSDSADGEDQKDEDEDDDAEDDEDEQVGPIAIDFEGLARRVARVPVDADNYGGLTALESHLLYVRGGPWYYGRGGDVQPELRIFDLEEREEKTLAENVRGYAVSADGKKVLVRTRGGFQLLDAKPDAKGEDVSTADLEVDRVPAEEWAQIFDEVWRRFRDYFYVENMHGYDWEALRAQYRPLLEHVAHRSDLNYVIAEMIGELNCSHTYVAGGDYAAPDRPSVALLGARLELDEESGRYRVADVFAGQNEEENYRSPLTEIGVGVGAGDWLVAINGRALTADVNPYAILRHAGGEALELGVVAAADGPGGEVRHVTVRPIRSEDDLLYLRWTEDNRRRVEEASGGRLGYLHLPDMGGNGIREFVKWFYGQTRKEGLVVDVRSNGGGNVSSMILERLRRELLMVDFERNVDYPEPYPQVMLHGHMVCLLDEDTASDGDQFAYAFQRAGLGELIGKRSWGGVVGIYGHGPLIDGGSVSVPEAGTADPEGRWAIEGHGVDPDVEVDNDPADLIAGRDAQLEKAIEVLLGKLETQPMTLPERPLDPVKTQ